MSIYYIDPCEGHWIIVRNILKYLHKFKDVFKMILKSYLRYVLIFPK